MSNNRILIVAAISLATNVSIAQAPRQQDRAVDMGITVRPTRNGAAQVAYLAIRQEIRGDVAATPFVLKLPSSAAGKVGIADRVDNIVLQDASGVVPLRVEQEPGDSLGFNTLNRRWHATRPVVAPLTLTYRVRPTVRTGGPMYEFYAFAGGVSVSGSHHIIIPETIKDARMRVHWDLSDLAPGSVFASSSGKGDFELRGDPGQRLTRGIYMAGPLGAYEANDGSGFSVHWLGRPPFDPVAEYKWAHQVYNMHRAFFRDTTTKSFRGFLIAGGFGGGNGTGSGFIVSSPPWTPTSIDSTPDRHRHTLAHEVQHYFVGGVSDESGERMATSHWFSEGLNMYYTRLLLLRSGLSSPDEYEADLDGGTRAFYPNPYRTVSNDSLGKVGFSAGFGGAGAALSIPYRRGFLFWAELDTRIREKSRNRRNLDDVLVPLLARRINEGEPLKFATLMNALTNELGPVVKERFDAVIVRGELIVPPSHAFGPCFERTTKTFTADGKEIQGYEWDRIPSVPDERCRSW